MDVDNGTLAIGLNDSGFVVGHANAGAEAFPYAPFTVYYFPSALFYHEMLCYGTTPTKTYLPLTTNNQSAIFGSVVESGQTGVRTSFLATPLSGRGMYTASADSYDFTPGQTHRVTISNYGTARLTLANVRVSGDPSQPQPHFSVSGCRNDGNGNIKSVNLEPGSGCTLTITRVDSSSGGFENYVLIDNSGRAFVGPDAVTLFAPEVR